MRVTVIQLFWFPLLFSNCVCAAEQAWGESTNGLRVGISCAVAESPADKQPKFTVRLKNVSENEIFIPGPEAILPLGAPHRPGYRAGPLKPVIVCVRGQKQMESLGSGPKLGEVKMDAVSLKPGETLDLKDVPLEERYTGDFTDGRAEDEVRPRTCWLMPESAYSVRFCFENEAAALGGHKLWIGKALSNEVEVKIARPSAAQFELDAAFSIPKHDFFLGEPIHVTFSVTNRGDKEIAFSHGGDYRSTGRPERFKFKAIGENGEAAKDPVVPGMICGGLGGEHVLKPGETHSEELLASAWFALEGPGQYTLACSRTLSLHFTGDGLEYMEWLYANYPVEAKLKISVRSDAGALEKYLKELVPGIIKNGTRADELQSLAAAKSDAAFPFVKEVLLNRGPEQRYAVHWISEYGPKKAGPVLLQAWRESKSEEARGSIFSQLQYWKLLTEEVVQTCLKEQEAWNRSRGLYALGDLRYASCYEKVLELENDPSPEVRKHIPYVLRMYGKKKEAMPVLLRLLSDKEPDIETRINAAKELKEWGNTDGVGVLMGLLGERANKSDHWRIINALQHITGERFEDAVEWFKWWLKNKPQPPG
ncbi:MAG: HEAT repeat domain-containing protein [Planctomycetota bacterium]